MSEDGLAMWTIYDRPFDFPNMYVARKFVIGRGARPQATDHTIVGDDLEPIRAGFRRAGLTCLPRADADDPKIIEVWL